MAGLVPGIHVFVSHSEKDVDGRDKPGHDEGYAAPFTCQRRYRPVVAIRSANSLSSSGNNTMPS